MKKKYFILALTFLCLLMGQSSFAQEKSGDFDQGNTSIDKIVEGLLRLNSDITVFEFSDTGDYVNAVNNDANPDNNFVDMNGDGFINTNDNLFNQNIANIFDLPITMSDAELANVLDGIIESNRLREVVIYRPNTFPIEDPSQWDYQIAYIVDDYENSLWINSTNSNNSGGNNSNTNSGSSQGSNPIKDKILAMLEAAGIKTIAMNPLTRTVTIARAIASYSIIAAFSDSSCNGTTGGCQSWMNSNYIGPTSSKLPTIQQFQNGVKPIDIVDRAAFNHDVAYDNLGAAGATSALFDLNTLPADRALLAACHQVTDMYLNGDIDPVTGQAVSSVTRERALLVIMAFEIIVTEKTLRN